VTCSVLVVGMPSPAGCASTKTWRAAAALVEQRLAERFGPAVTFEYAELFGPEMARHTDISAIERAVAGALYPVSATAPGAETASLSAREAAPHA
jgi:hypothetical protein